MSIRLKCPCGQMLNVPDGAVGKKTRCPSCQTLLQVPFVASPAQSAPDPFADLPTHTPLSPSSVPRPQPTYQQPPQQSRASYQMGPGYHVPQHSSGGRRLVIALMLSVFGTGVLMLGGVVVWISLGLFSREPQIEDSFTPVPPVASASSTPGTPAAAPGNGMASPVAPVGKNPREASMLAIAEKFIRHAQQNEHHEAVAMIDAKLFHTRLYSAKGSYEAMINDIPAGKLLSNFGGYALDGVPVGGHRHWQIIGTSQFDGNPGVIVRYFVETQSPLDALTDTKLFNRLGAVVSYDQLSKQAGNLFTADGQKESQFDRYSLSGHAIHRVFPARAGYMMLVFDGQEADPKLIDLVNVLGQSPLSRTGAHVFLDDYQIIGGFGTRETYGTKRSTVTVYGITAVTSGASWDPNDPGAEARARQQAADATAAEEQKRPKRLEKLVEMWLQSDSALQSELARFRSDFPGDLGFELAVVCSKMAQREPTFTAPQDRIVAQAAQSLYQQWRDPFFQYVEALYEQQNGRAAEANALFAKCVTAGFAPADYYVQRIEAALDRSDTTAVFTALKEWNQARAVDGLSPDKDRLAKLAGRYEVLDRVLNPQPTLSERMASSSRGPLADRLRRPGDEGTGDVGATTGLGRSPSEATSGNAGPPLGPPPGFGQPPEMRPSPFAPGQMPPRPPAPSGPQVIIKIASDHDFDGHAIARRLAASLKVSSYQHSQSNRTATLTLSFSGPLQQVMDAIDFGEVKSSDDTTKTIEVQIP